MSNTRSHTSPQADLKKSTVQLFLAAAAWVGSTALMSFGPSAFWDFDTAITFLAIVANLIVGVLMLYSFFRHLKNMDELQRQTHLEAMALKPFKSSPSSPLIGRSTLDLKLPLAISLTPITNSLIGLVIVRALNTAPIITKTHIEINTATVISLVRAAVASAFLFGVTPSAKVPRYSPFQSIGTKTSVT